MAKGRRISMEEARLIALAAGKLVDRLMKEDMERDMDEGKGLGKGYDEDEKPVPGLPLGYREGDPPRPPTWGEYAESVVMPNPWRIDRRRIR